MSSYPIGWIIVGHGVWIRIAYILKCHEVEIRWILTLDMAPFAFLRPLLKMATLSSEHLFCKCIPVKCQVYGKNSAKLACLEQNMNFFVVIPFQFLKDEVYSGHAF